MSEYVVSERVRNVYQYVETGKWFFSDETEAENGPYDTEAEAYREFHRYFHWLDCGVVLTDEEIAARELK